MILELFEKQFCKPLLNSPESLLLQFTRLAKFRVKDLFENIAIVGATGSGKTSATLALRQSILRHGLGALICCVKPDEAAEWLKVIRKCKREKDVIHFKAGGPHRFDPFEWLSNPSEAAQFMQQLCLTLEGNHKSTSENSEYWKNESFKFLLNALMLIYYAFGKLDWTKTAEIINSGPLKSRSGAL